MSLLIRISWDVDIRKKWDLCQFAILIIQMFCQTYADVENKTR